LTFEAGVRGALAHAFKRTLCSFDIALEDSNFVSLPVKFEHTFFLDLHCFKQFLFLLLAHFVRSADTVGDLLNFAGKPSPEGSNL
jgi:hypothetical protein